MSPFHHPGILHWRERLALGVVLPLALFLACGGESFSLGSSPEHGTESCEAVMGFRPGRPRPPRCRVALSLLVGQVDLYLVHMLKTLTGSDVNDHDVGLFAWVNCCPPSNETVCREGGSGGR